MRAAYAIGLLVCVAWQVRADDDIITEPRPGDEYVIVSSGQQTQLRNFESSHKIPDKHPHHRLLKSEDEDKTNHKVHKGKVARHIISEGIISIEENKKINYDKVSNKAKIAESVEIDVPYSKLEKIKIPENSKNIETNPNLNVALEAMSESGKLLESAGTTTQKPILTTAASSSAQFDYIPINIDNSDNVNSGLFSSNVNLETAGSAKKQHSRIQIKKGPNGQDYEYEYIYYYYDDDESPTNTPAVHNAHDGPKKSETENQIIKESSKNKYNSIDRISATTYAPSSGTTEVHNEINSGRGRQRSRTLDPAPVQEEITNDRLPSSTRFPPRSANLASSSTPYVPEVTTEQRPRSRSDSNSDEAHPRPRTRSHIRQPSSKLVDLDSFNAGGPSNQYKEPPPRYVATSKTTTETYESTTTSSTESERMGHSLASGSRHQTILDDSKTTADYKTTTNYDHETTEYTTMTAMEKVALELYAYLAGENLNNDVSSTQTDVTGTDEPTTFADDASTTELVSTTQEATTTTTTTTTTPAPTTTTTTTTTTTAAPSTRASRFKLRSGARGRVTLSTSTTEATQQETSTKAKGRFERPRPGSPRQGARTTASTTTAAASAAAAPGDAGELHPPTHAKPLGTRRGLFANRRTPGSATPASTSTTPAAPAVEDAAASTSGAPASTSRPLVRGRPNIHPLRPGPRLNLRAGGRIGGATQPTPAVDSETEPSVEPVASSSEPAAVENVDAENAASSAPPEIPRPGLRLRTRIVPSPRPHVSTVAPARRPNPLLKRKLTTKTPIPAKKPRESEEEDVLSSAPAEESQPTEAAPAATETTPAPAPASPPRGLEALFARRRSNRQSQPSPKQN